MNLSSSFDHRFVDGCDAAAMIQSIKEMLEHPATFFVDWGVEKICSVANIVLCGPFEERKPSRHTPAFAADPAG